MSQRRKVALYTFLFVACISRYSSPLGHLFLLNACRTTLQLVMFTTNKWNLEEALSDCILTKPPLCDLIKTSCRQNRNFNYDL